MHSKDFFAQKIVNDLKLCLISKMQKKSLDDYKNFLLKAVRGGITAVQLREKTKNIAEICNIALELKTFLKPLKIPLIINDHVNIVKEIDAEGVHLGPSDISPLKARRILGEDKMIGLSIESFEELTIANQLSCINYIAASAIFPSENKSNCKMLWGIEGLQEIVRRSQHPVVAIGGINLSNIRNVIESGACGVAVISAIHKHSDATLASYELIQAMK